MPSCSVLLPGTGRERSLNAKDAGKQGSNMHLQDRQDLQHLSRLNPARSRSRAHTEHCETFSKHHGHKLPADLQSPKSHNAQKQHLNTKSEQQKEGSESLSPAAPTRKAAGPYGPAAPTPRAAHERRQHRQSPGADEAGPSQS